MATSASFNRNNQESGDAEIPQGGLVQCRLCRDRHNRHCFATRKLIEWYRAGLDVGRELPKLATYLGHVDVAHTYWYLEAVPELLQLATDRLGTHRLGDQQ